MDTALHTWAIAHGPLGLAALSFLAATILPFSSEVALVAGIKAGIPTSHALLACSLGNCLACLVNYGLGALGRDRTEPRLQQSRSGRLALQWTDRYGLLSLLGSWLPVIGDPLTIVAGIARVSLWYFIPIVCSLRIARYLALAWAL